MGHLGSDCPKLRKTYPLCTLVPESGNVCMGSANEGVAEHKGSMVKIKYGDNSELQDRGKVYDRDGSIPGNPELSGSTEVELDPSLGGMWEVEQGEEQVLDVQGRLSKCISFWEDDLKAMGPVIDCIREGTSFLC